MIVGPQIERLSNLCARRAGAIVTALTALMIAAYVGAALIFPKPDRRVLFGDAVHHFVQLRSLVFDHDLDFRNEYVRLYRLEGEIKGSEWLSSELTVTGHVRNYMPIGPALLWLPLYLLAAAAQGALAWAGWAAPPDGFNPVLQLVPGVTGILGAGAATWISLRLAGRFTDRGSASAAALGVWLGTHALYYSLVSPAYSHAASMLTSSCLFAYWLRVRETPTVASFAGIGALVGVCSLMRWQDASFLVLPAIDLLRWRAPLTRRSAGALATLAAWAVVFSPQMAIWNVLYGAPLAIPQGPSFMQWTSPHLIAVLFSDGHGLFSWAPLLLVSVAGLCTFTARHRAAGLSILAASAIAWYINAAVADWWAGEAFGARRFLSLYPLFVLGLAVWLHQPALRRPAPGRLAAVIVLVAVNGLLFVQYELFMKGQRALAPYPHGWYDMYVERFVVPIRLVVRWLS
jgi:hypothetical protein